MYFSEQGNVDDDATLITIILVSFNLQSCCLMQTADCSLQSAVCGLQSANVIHRQAFDESSDEELEVSADDNNSQGQQDELGASTNFLFGARSRYGRAVRFNNRLLF